MDERLVLLDARVAEAAEAWLTDPRDAGVYARLVAAVEARRAHLHPAEPVDPVDAQDLEVPGDDDHEDPDAIEPDVPDVEPLATALGGFGDLADPREVLARLRRGG
ncbi:hypothetical protein [Angustibacter aerolatus]|uniref:Transcriptional regulator n=1 Tax=Angustibacter aerolatus TaxID=1162965 RepID=A0ABQ6JQJ7_9ACTN|nr:hypothetical protein GCM10025868_42060 [Angustibacter aerolatus]